MANTDRCLIMCVFCSLHLHARCHDGLVGGFDCRRTFTLGSDMRVQLSDGAGGQAAELLHSEEEFCSADDYTCRADATPAAGALAAKVPATGWHGERPKGTGRVCVCVCVCWLVTTTQRETVP